jgi:hypothetical protein
MNTWTIAGIGVAVVLVLAGCSGTTGGAGGVDRCATENPDPKDYNSLIGCLYAVSPNVQSDPVLKVVNLVNQGASGGGSQTGYKSGFEDGFDWGWVGGYGADIDCRDAGPGSSVCNEITCVYPRQFDRSASGTAQRPWLCSSARPPYQPILTAKP